MKKITIQNEATINARGKYNSKHCKPVMCIKADGSELHSFSSVWDAANELGISRSYISTCMNNETPCKGYIFFDTKDAPSHIGKIVSYYNANAKDASDYRRIKAEEERRLEEERKAREKHEAEVEKARAKIAKLTENCNNLEAKLLEEERALMEAETALANLLGENQQVA